MQRPPPGPGRAPGEQRLQHEQDEDGTHKDRGHIQHQAEEQRLAVGAGTAGAIGANDAGVVDRVIPDTAGNRHDQGEVEQGQQDHQHGNRHHRQPVTCRCADGPDPVLGESSLDLFREVGEPFRRGGDRGNTIGWY